MRIRRPLGLPVRLQGEVADCVNSDVAHTKDDVPMEVNARKPFIERRRSRRVEQSWSEALDSLQRILLGFENGTKDPTDTEGKFRTIFEEAPVGIFELSEEGHVVNLNSAMACILGHESSEQALAQASVGPTSFFDPIQWKSFESSVGKKEVRCFDLQIRSAEGQDRWVRCHVREVSDHSSGARYEGTAEDVTERKLVEIQTERLAYYDTLTGLPNRTLFRVRLQSAIQGALSRKSRFACFFSRSTDSKSSMTRLVSASGIGFCKKLPSVLLLRLGGTASWPASVARNLLPSSRSIFSKASRRLPNG